MVIPALIGFLQEFDVPFISISAPSIVSGMSGESEKTLRDTFEEAKVYTIAVRFCHFLIFVIAGCTLSIIHR